jgi:hypothetical protein
MGQTLSHLASEASDSAVTFLIEAFVQMELLLFLLL